MGCRSLARTYTTNEIRNKTATSVTAFAYSGAVFFVAGSAVKILFVARILILIRPSDQIIPRKKGLDAMLLPYASIPRHVDLLFGAWNRPMIFAAGTQHQEKCAENWYFPPICPSEKSEYW